MLEQVLGLLIAGVHRDELDLLQMYDDAVLAEEDVSGRPGPEQPGVSAAQSDAAGQRGSRGSDCSPLASPCDAGPGPGALKRPAIRTDRRSRKL